MKFIKEIFRRYNLYPSMERKLEITEYDLKSSKTELNDLKKIRNDLGYKIQSLKTEIEVAAKYLNESEKQIKKLIQRNAELSANNAIVSQQEKYWNNKRKATKWLYRARDKHKVDPRIFWQTDSTLPHFKREKDNDTKALKCLQYVKKYIKYTLKDEKDKEYWKFAYETLRDKRGDCEDGAILMANMMISSGVPYWRIRLNAGHVKGGGHAYVTYLKEKDNQWYVLDWCYWYNPNGTLWNNAHKYYSDSDGKKGFGIWGSWNKKYIFGDLPKNVNKKRTNK